MENTFVPSGFCKHRQKHNRQLLCVIGLLTLFVGGMPLIAFPQNLSSANNLTVRGQVRLPSDRAMPDEGLDVVLLKFVLSPEGQVTPTGPQGRDKTDTGGNFEFVKVSPDLRAGYQIGTRVEGELYSSKVFFMQAGEKLIKIDIIVPSISADVEKLETSQVSLVIESGLGAITVTEMLVINNSSPDRIDTRTKPLEQVLPKGFENFRMIETKSGATIQHQLEANLLEIEHVFPTGSTQIIYQYRLSAWFGSLEMNREFSHSLEKVSVFTPDGLLRIKSDQLTFSGQQLTVTGTRVVSADSHTLLAVFRPAKFARHSFSKLEKQGFRHESFEFQNQQHPSSFVAIYWHSSSNTVFIVCSSSIVFSNPSA